MSTVFAINIKMLLVAIANAIPVLKRSQRASHTSLAQIEVEVKDGFLLLTCTDRFVIVKTKVEIYGDNIPVGEKFYLTLEDVTALKAFKSSKISYKDRQLHVENVGISFGSDQAYGEGFPAIEKLWLDQLNDFPIEGEHTGGGGVDPSLIKHIKGVIITPRDVKRPWLFTTEDKITAGIIMPRRPIVGIAGEIRRAGF